MKNNPLISVIVPCYNVEQYLPKCVDSILSQTYTNLEIWLVDDGSPDRCGKICDEYAVKDKRVKVIHKENGGLSDARNVALEQMTGDWVTFIDSDDTVTADYIERMLNQADTTGADMVVTNWNMFYEGEAPADVSQWKEHRKVFTWKEAFISMMYQRDFDTAACVKLYKVELFNEQRFPIGWISEDLAIIYKVLMKTKIVAWNDYPCYNYLLRRDSIEGCGFSERKFHSYMNIIEMFERDMEQMDDDLRKAIRCRIVSLLFHILLVMPVTEKKRTLRIWHMLKRYRWGVLLDHHARLKTRMALLISLGGITCVRMLARYGCYRIK